MALLRNASVKPWIDGIAWHCYGGSEAAQTPVHNLDLSKEVHVTECSGGGWSGPWDENFISNMRRLFVGAANNWAQSTMLWNMALDENAGPRCQGGACCSDCRGVLTIPSNASSMDDITRNVEFYSLAHFSALVPQGSVRVRSQRAPPDNASQVGEARSCASYCVSTGCGWTKQFSCPWMKTPGTKGRAGDDGSVGYQCCCGDRSSPDQPCGGNGTDGGRTSVQFTAFVTPAQEVVLQVLNPTSTAQKVSVSDGGKRGFEYDVPPGFASFVW
eukprot:SAG31_NODE_1291_length_8975_cov_26.197274_4_plen_272_part_00